MQPDYREKIASVNAELHKRQQKEQQARAAFDRSKDRLLTIAQTLLEHTAVKIEQAADGSITLDAPPGARAVFAFDPVSLALVGTRYQRADEKGGETFLSLKIEPPARPQPSAGPNQWGPSAVPLPASMQPIGSLEAYQKAIADWYEWAHIGNGAARP